MLINISLQCKSLAIAKKIGLWYIIFNKENLFMEKKVKQDILDRIKVILDYEAKYKILSEAHDRQDIMRKYLELALTQLLLIEFEKDHINYIPTTKEIDGDTISPLDFLKANGLNMEWISECKSEDIKIRFVYGNGKYDTFFSSGKFDKNSQTFPNKILNISIDRFDTVEDLLIKLYHEMSHLKQFLKVQSGVINKENLRMAKEFAAISGNRSLYKHYKKISHDLFYIEADADENAYKECEELFGGKYTRKRQRANRQKNIGMFVDYYTGENVNPEEYFDGAISHLATSYESRDVLEQIPILKKIYSPYSGRLQTEILIQNMNKDIENADYRICNKKDIEEMYYEEICRNLENIHEEDYNRLIHKVDRKELQELLIKIESYLKKERDHKIEICKQTNDVGDTEHNYFANNGYIQNGDEILSIDEFISELDNDILDRKINFKNATYRDLLKDKKVRELLPAKGIIRLKSGEVISLKDFLEKEVLSNEPCSSMLQVIDSPIDYFGYILSDIVSDNQENSNENIEEEIAKYYDKKISIIKRFLSNLKDKKILPKDVARMALVGTTTGKVTETEKVEQSELNPKNIKQGEIQHD